MDTTPSDRVQLIGQSQLMHPGCCALCGSGNCDDGYIDTGIYYDYEGQVYFCMTCVDQIINVVGAFTSDEVAIQKGLLDTTVAELSSVKSELEKANERLGHYDSLLAGIASAQSDGLVTTYLGPNAVAQEQSEVTNESAKSTNTEQPVTTESSKGTGRRKPARPEFSDSSTTDSGLTI